MIITITGFTMRLREFNVNDSIVAALGVGGIVWLGIVYLEVFRRYEFGRLFLSNIQRV